MTEFRKSCSDGMDYKFDRVSTSANVVVIDFLGNDVVTAIIKTELEKEKPRQGNEPGYAIGLGKDGLKKFYNFHIICDAVYHNNNTLRLFTSGYDKPKLFFLIDAILNETTFTGVKVRVVNNGSDIKPIFSEMKYEKLKEDDVYLHTSSTCFMGDLIKELNSI